MNIKIRRLGRDDTSAFVQHAELLDDAHATRSASGSRERALAEHRWNQVGGGDVGLRVRGRLTELRPATADDVERLCVWHADPEVARYWDDETFTHEEMVERLARADVDAWIVEADGEPIGYLQTHPEGLDMFLVPSARGRGLGPDAGRAMARHLLASGRTRVTVDPYEWNESAIRSWQRAGFVEVSRGHPPDEDHAAPWVLMEYRES